MRAVTLPTGVLRRSRLLLILVVCLSGLGGVAAQGASRAADLEFGFGGAIVADAWNPLRLVLRDVGSVVLEVAIDRGTLRDGERWSVYRAELPGGSGLSVFEDELYVPVWRSLQWTVRSDGLLVASGSVPRTQADRRLLTLIVGEPGPALRARLGGVRSVDVAADRLPLRSAAYDGVADVVIATPSARPQALLAAAVAGASVVLTPAASDAPGLAELLGPDGAARRLGSGAVGSVTGSLGDAAARAREVDHGALVSALVAAERLAPPRTQPVVPLLAGAAAYALVVLVLLRFGGLPGAIAVAVVGLAASAAAWLPLRPAESGVERVRDLIVGADGIGQRWRLHEHLTLPARTLTLGVAGWTLSDLDARLGPSRTEVDLARWRSVVVVERPRAAALPLRQLEDGTWRNDGDLPLSLVVLPDGVAVRDVAPGAAVPAPTTDAGPLPGVAEALRSLAPAGAALAYDGERWMLALSQDVMAEAAP